MISHTAYTYNLSQKLIAYSISYNTFDKHSHLWAPLSRLRFVEFIGAESLANTAV